MVCVSRMKQRVTFFTPKLNLITVYVLGFLFISLAISYNLWSNYKYRTVYEAAEAVVELSAEQVVAAEEAKISEEKDLNPEFIISEGDTLASILNEAGISKADANAFIAAFAKKYNPRKLNIGTVISFKFAEDSQFKLVMTSATINVSNLSKIEVANIDGKFIAIEVAVPLVRKVMKLSGVIKNSFIATAAELSIPHSAILGMIRAFSYDVDFQRDIKRGDKLEVILDQFYTEEGKMSHAGNILYSSLTVGDKKISIYQFTHDDGQVAYYNEKGESIKKEFLRTPINATRISSKFGSRNHPVLGYTKMHKGIDFAAPVGTPIIAAGSGVVEAAHRFGGYGKYIRIKHNSTYSTAYAHASHFAKGIRAGSKVSQGQVIAYVGTTGITTGPHLHYEVLENGKHINPLKFKFASKSEKLTGKDAEKFKQMKKKIDKNLTSGDNVEILGL